MTARVIKRGSKVDVREAVGVGQLAIPRRAAGRLRERLSENLSRRFVGRDAEISLFKDVLNSGQAALLWVYGPGGVGKSTLLHRLAQLASDRGMPVLFPDARDLPPTQKVSSRACAKHWNPRSPPSKMAGSGG